MNLAGLQPGVYTGNIVVSGTFLNVLTQTIPVTLTVASGTISAAPSTLTFSETFNGAAPASQTVQIIGVPQTVSIGTSVTTFSGANWLSTVSFEGTIKVSVNSGLNRGTYTGVITVIAPGVSNSPLYIPVTLTVS